MICVSLGEKHLPDLLKRLERFPFVEVRLDKLFEMPSVADIDRIFKRRGKMIATFRRGNSNGGERIALLERALAAGADFVDIELEETEEAYERILAVARRYKRKMLISHHDYQNTPSGWRLTEIRDRCAARGADIVKIACKIDRREHCARLLALIDGPTPVIAIGMGLMGRITRLAGPLIGSPFTYACAERGSETADGQFDFETMTFLMNNVLGMPR